jgi:hemolysin III
VLEKRTGYFLLSLVWGIAIVGILVKYVWIFCPKWVSSILYIGMGWICVVAFSQILNNLSKAAFFWLLLGGIIYTIGGVLYALRTPAFDERHKYFGMHEIFHLFVMGGSICHFILMYVFLLP